MIIAMFVLSGLVVGTLIYTTYQWQNSSVEIAKLGSILTEKESIIGALKAHIKRLEAQNDFCDATLKNIKADHARLSSELQSCTDKAKAAKAKAAKSATDTKATVKAPVMTESKSKRSYNKKSK